MIYACIMYVWNLRAKKILRSLSLSEACTDMLLRRAAVAE
jgi:hypothetical protein